jgi:hypothetical protein
MTPHRAPHRHILLLALVLASACATSGLHRIAVASEAAIGAVERLQRAADDLERSGAITTPQRTALSPYFIKIAQGDLALNAAIRAADAHGVQAQAIGMLAVLDQVQRDELVPLSPQARTVITVAIEAVRSALVVISAEVTP